MPSRQSLDLKLSGNFSNRALMQQPKIMEQESNLA
jgi:hypothetical protein